MNTYIDLPFLIRTTCPNGFIRFNETFSKRVGISKKELSEKSFVEFIFKEDQPKFLELTEGKLSACKIRHITKDGKGLLLKVKMSDKVDDKFVILAQEESEELVTHFYNGDKEQGNVKDTLHEIAFIVEEQNPGFKCSILLVEDGHFVKGAGPSLPDDYNNAIDGFAIGPTVGSCGTAIYWNVPVIVTDIQSDPLWAPFAELAKGAGVNACWSHPFISKSGNVLGALAFYSTETNVPNEAQFSQLRAAARLTGLAVERGRAEEALRLKHEQGLVLQDQLRQAAKMEALGVLAGGVAHDFNNVLTAMLANAEFSQLLIKNMEDSNEKIKIDTKLKNIIKAGSRASGFCKQLLSYAGDGSTEIQNIEIDKLLLEIDSLVTAAISKKTILKFDFVEGPIVISGDENQIIQVMMNLITNAGDVLKESGGKILVSTRLANYTAEELKTYSPESELPSGQYLRFTVEDNGSGIPENIQAKIFDPFYSSKSSGRGLGLSAVKGIVKMHSGVIFFKSELSRGTIFTVLLPTMEVEEKIQDSKKIDKTEVQEERNKRILYVEDEIDILDIMTDTLELHGFDVTPAINGQEGVDLFTKSPSSFDCVVLDLNMPILGGMDAAKIIHEIDKETPIIIMSGNIAQLTEDGFDESILAGTLLKPAVIQEIIELIDNSIGKK